MAMAIGSCPKQYYHTAGLTNNSFSFHRTKPYLIKISPCNSSSYHNCGLVQEDDDAFPVPSPAGTSLLLHERPQHLSYSMREMMEKALDIEGSESDLMREEWQNEVKLMRRRRRRKRSDFQDLGKAEDEELASVDMKAEGHVRQSRFLTPKEEAKYSWYLKERARIEAVRMKLVAEMGGRHELESSQWAKAAGISQHRLDRILCNGRESEERITRCYQNLVISVASSYQGKGLSLKDLTQEGCIGLLRGAVKFNPDKGYKLSTYAYWWIRQAITRAIANKSKIIRLPGSIIELVPRICEASTSLTRSLQRFPTYDEIAEEIDANPSVVRLALERNRSPISLDQAITGRGCMSLQDIIPGPDEMIPETMMKNDMLKPEIQKLLRPLCEREAHILRLHYGLNGETPWSFEEIGRFLKLSRERVRQINSTALSKLRQTNGINDLKYFIHNV